MGSLLLIVGACGGNHESARDIVEKRFPECLRAADDDNITVKGGVIRVFCNIEADGPVHYLDAGSGKLICSCGTGGSWAASPG